jgi:hypothetical protein
MRGPWGPQTNIFYFVCVVPVVIYLFHASWGLTHVVHGVEISSFSSQIMLIPGPLGPRGLAVTGGHPRIIMRAQLDCPWPEPYKSQCPCHLENFYLFWPILPFLITIFAISCHFYAANGAPEALFPIIMIYMVFLKVIYLYQIEIWIILIINLNVKGNEYQKSIKITDFSDFFDKCSFRARSVLLALFVEFLTFFFGFPMQF